MLKLISIAIITMALNGVIIAAAYSADRYGAIAYSPNTRAVGWSHKYQSQFDAEERALDGCYKHADDCKIVMWTKNACAALAIGRNGGWGAGWHKNPETAKISALVQCSKKNLGCEVKRSICT